MADQLLDLSLERRGLISHIFKDLNLPLYLGKLMVQCTMCAKHVLISLLDSCTFEFIPEFLSGHVQSGMIHLNKMLEGGSKRRTDFGLGYRQQYCWAVNM